MKIRRISKEVCGINMKYGKRYKIVCKDDKIYEGEYVGYDQSYQMLHQGRYILSVKTSRIKSVEMK